ncbi:flagellar basal body-associated FliL family protein [Thalassobacillus sp. CUG 92003]|uniref:flagellar basal body-associated FliL family protein n=1 Tax=Thalassobacillus sp. CUG 92003 TaxID=2736641 RepID=UPI0015E64C8A|nr:flagellar basal body-associated FliL family protein [Thalassobacillus sp. CUG 92003]
MSRNKFKPILVITGTLVTIGVVGLVVLFNFTGQAEESGERSIEEIRETSIETQELTTDLQDDMYVKVQFRIVAKSDKGKKELQQRDFQLQNLLLKELAGMESQDFKSDLSELESTIKMRLNELMTKGEITDVYTIQKVLQ